MRDPVERPRQGERRHFGVTGMNRAVLHALAQQTPDALIDFGLQRLDVRAHARRQVQILGAHHAPAELRGHRLGVMSQHRIQSFAGADVELLHFAECRADLLHSGEEALEQQLFFVGDVVVNGGFRYLERRRDVVQRGVVVTLFVEGARCGPNDCVALDGPVLHPVAARPPRRRRGRRWGKRGRGGATGGRGAAAAGLTGRRCGARSTDGHGVQYTQSYCWVGSPTRG